MPHGLISPAQIRGQLERVSNSPEFRAAGRLRDFLQFIVVETIEGRAREIKEYSIGISVYARGSLFDPKLDCIVRVEAIKLRSRLDAYYAREGSADEVLITVPKGAYVPDFHNRGRPLVTGSSGWYEIAELCDVASLALMRRTPAAIAMGTKCFVQARTLNPGEVRTHLGIATGYTAALDIEIVSPAGIVGDLESSVSQALQLNEDSGEAHLLASLWLATREGIGTRAIKELTCAMKLEPRSPAGHFWAAGLLSTQGAHQASIEHFYKAIRCAPDCALFRAYLGRALYYAREFPEALDVLKEVLSIDSALAVGHLWAALVQSELGRHDEAIEAGLQAIERSETSATLSTNAYVLARAGRLEDAECILDRLTQSPPYGYVSPLQLAVITQALGRTKEAAMHLAAARRDNAWALLWKEVDPRLSRIDARW